MKKEKRMRSVRECLDYCQVKVLRAIAPLVIVSVFQIPLMLPTGIILNIGLFVLKARFRITPLHFKVKAAMKTQKKSSLPENFSGRD